jgi:hypothetical protein
MKFNAFPVAKKAMNWDETNCIVMYVLRFFLEKTFEFKTLAFLWGGMVFRIE